MAKSRGRFFKRPLLFAEEDSPVLERPEQIMVDLVVFLRKNIKNDQEPGRGISIFFYGFDCDFRCVPAGKMKFSGRDAAKCDGAQPVLFRQRKTGTVTGRQ